MGKPAARVTDMHTCPIPTHVGGLVIPPGKPTVWIGGMPAATVGTLCACAGPPDVIVQGSRSVFIGGMPAARLGDMTAHGGRIITGCPTVLIGDFGGSGIDATNINNSLAPPAVDSPEPSRAAPGQPSSAEGAAPVAGAPPTMLTGPCAYLNKQTLVSATPADFDRIRRPVTLSAPREITHSFPGGSGAEAALEYDVTVDGRTTQLIMPRATPANGHLPTANQLAQSLGTVPRPALDTFPRVVASPYPSPSDAYWQRFYNRPDHRAAADANTQGVNFYPIPFVPAQGLVDSNMIHESGHPLSMTRWTSFSGRQTAWEEAMRQDGNSPSTYGDSTTAEDFSESLVMYRLSQGTACEAEARQRFPNRYRYLDGILGLRSDSSTPAPAIPAAPPRRSFWDRLFGR